MVSYLLACHSFLLETIMAIYLTSPIQGTVATVGAVGTSVAPPQAVPDNCHTMIIYNDNASNSLIINTGSAGGALSQATSVTVPPQGSLTLAIGVLSKRNGASNFIYDAVGGATVGRITYVCGIET